jgi:uncharacterized protein (DUF2141 family)
MLFRLSVISISLAQFAFLSCSLCKADPPALPITSENDGGVSLTVNISNVKNSNGTLVLFLFDQSKGFPSEKQSTLATRTIKIVSGKGAHTFQGLAANTPYAVSVMHDENANGVMDSNFLGIPKEGYATSNNVPHSMFGPPKFEDAKIQFSESSKLQIKMLY